MHLFLNHRDKGVDIPQVGTGKTIFVNIIVGSLDGVERCEYLSFIATAGRHNTVTRKIHHQAIDFVKH